MTQAERMLTLLRATVLLFASPAHGQRVEKTIQVKIPFEFTMGQKSFPAGTYTLVHSTGLLYSAGFAGIPYRRSAYSTQHQQHRSLTSMWWRDVMCWDVCGRRTSYTGMSFSVQKRRERNWRSIQLNRRR